MNIAQHTTQKPWNATAGAKEITICKTLLRDCFRPQVEVMLACIRNHTDCSTALAFSNELVKLASDIQISATETLNK